MRRLNAIWTMAAIVVPALAGCTPKASLDDSQVEIVMVEGRRYEVRIAPTGTPNEYRMLIVRATLVINPDPETESERAQAVAARYMKRTCKNRPYEEIVAGLQGEVNYRTLFVCR